MHEESRDRQNLTHDPRARGFRVRCSVVELNGLIDARVHQLDPELVDLTAAAGRVAAREVYAAEAVPAFDRAAMDGYAVRGEETFGAGPYQPIAFRCVGASRPGIRPTASAGTGRAVAITTGAPLPEGADTVVKVESTRAEGDTVWITEPTPPGRNVGLRGEDLAEGAQVLAAGRVIRPQDLGILSAVGAGSVCVIRRPRVAVVITGEELLPAGSPARDFQIPDMNSVMLGALIARDGGIARVMGPLADDRTRLVAAIAEAAQAADVVLISGGSSTGPEDHAPGVVAQLGELAVHGVAIRPASPTGLGFIGSVPVLLLPGNPVSCLCAYDFFGSRIVRALGGQPRVWPYQSREYPLARKLVSVLGRVDYARVRIVNGAVEPLASSGASILSSTTRADGFVVVPADLEGFPAGANVTVWHYDYVH